MRKTLDEVLAEAAIKDLQIRYCRAVDRMDWDLFRSCFHADALFDYAMSSGGLEPFIDAGIAMLAGYEATQHFTGNQLVEVNGDIAWAEHYAVATHRIAATADVPEHDLVTAIRYIDRAECRASASGPDWRIARRELILDGWRIDYDPEAGPGAGLPRKRSAKRDRTDRSYFGKA